MTPTDELLQRIGGGVDNVALDTATALGLAVINAPTGNTVAVAELFFGSVIGLLRHIPRGTHSMHEGQWDRADPMGTELCGKTRGIIGLGRIGSAVATRARAFAAFTAFVRRAPVVSVADLECASFRDLQHYVLGTA